MPSGGESYIYVVAPIDAFDLAVVVPIDASGLAIQAGLAW